jgi:hypothetical protein
MQQEEEEAEFGRLSGMPRRFTFEKLQEAIDQFREELREGGSGSVFNGCLGEEVIAVKRLDRMGQGKRILGRGSDHRQHSPFQSGEGNWLSFCAEKSHRLLVYEYMPKGSLDGWTSGSFTSTTMMTLLARIGKHDARLLLI